MGQHPIQFEYEAPRNRHIYQDFLQCDKPQKKEKPEMGIFQKTINSTSNRKAKMTISRFMRQQ